VQLIKYLPLASDRMGALWALASVKDACIIEYGPAGTTHYGIEGFMQLNAELMSRLFTTHMDETDIVMGDSTRLEKTILEVDQVYKPPVIFVVASSISSLIGTDLETICEALQPDVNAKLIALTGGGFRGDYALGIREVLTLLAKHVVKPPTKKHQNSYNIIGSNIDCYNFFSDLKELKTLMHECFGYELNAVFTANSSIEEIENAANAGINLVLRSEGVEAAEFLKEKYGIPYYSGLPYGYHGTQKWASGLAEVLSLELNEILKRTWMTAANKHGMALRRTLFNYGKLSCVLSGNFDQVYAMYVFLTEELGLDVKAVIVNHHKPSYMSDLSVELEEKLMFNPTEAEKEALVCEGRPDVVFGDGVLLHIGGEVPIKIQVANPNLDSIQIFDGTPYMGPRGATFIIEKLLAGIYANRQFLKERVR